MNPEAQRITIAEAVQQARYPGTNPTFNPHQSPYQRRQSLINCPDYPSDLNAMHEAEKVLSSGQSQAYGLHLARITSRRSWHAAAAQRAEAFLRTVGKWEMP